jgi:hypothetical protein
LDAEGDVGSYGAFAIMKSEEQSRVQVRSFILTFEGNLYLPRTTTVPWQLPYKFNKMNVVW